MTYEIMKPEDVGVRQSNLVLGKHSGRHALSQRLKDMGYNLSEKDLNTLFARFKELADKKKEVHTHDLYYLVDKFYVAQGKEQSEERQRCPLYQLESLQVVSNDVFPSANIKVKYGEQMIEESATGDGPIDALYTALKKAVALDVELDEWKITSISKGKEALGKVNLRLAYNGQKYTAKAIDTDIIKASAYAFINGVNAIILEGITVPAE